MVEQREQGEHTEHFPPLPPDRAVLVLPVVEVTVLEDRALVTRRGAVPASGEGDGRVKVALSPVSPLLQDVSLRATLEGQGARVADVRVRRALRVQRAQRPEHFTVLEVEAETLQQRLQAALDRRQRAEARYERLWEMLTQGAREIPEDAAWGRVDEELWRGTFQTLFERAREQQKALLDAHFEAEDAASDLGALLQRMALLDRPDVSVAAWIELDLVLEPGPRAAPLEASVSYVVPNALWRPLHRAELQNDVLKMTLRGAVWQRTGEDWENVRLQLSTARSALATEPPLLDDDLLQVKRKSEEVLLSAREVEVQTTGPGPEAGAPSEPASVELPGVDDGGEIRLLEVPGQVTVPSDGQPAFFDVATSESPALVERMSAPQVLPRVVVRCEATHTGRLPLLAGPVELVRDHGAIGWTEIPFVAPGARFELSFGPDDALRLQREASVRSEEDRLDKWLRRDHRVDLFLSNLGLQPATVTLIERVPVSEVEEVRIRVLDGTTGEGKPDAHGMLRWTVTVPPGGSEEIRLWYQVATAPGVKL